MQIKFQWIGFKSMDWFKSYLSASEQVVSTVNCFPRPKLICAIDLPQCLRHCKIILYADGTLIYYSAKTAYNVGLSEYINCFTIDTV